MQSQIKARPIRMSSKYLIFLVAGLLAGCATGTKTSIVAVTPLPQKTSTPPFSTSGRLTKSQLDWYIQRAVAWLQTDHDVMPDGTRLLRAGMIYGSAIDHSRSIECIQSDDGRTVTVKIPQEIKPDHETWMVLHFDTQSGDVQSYGNEDISISV
jgi:hypothetical protein